MKSSLFVLLVLVTRLTATPQLSSWYTNSSGSYARIYDSTAAQNAGTAVTTWSRGQGVQSSPTYAGVHRISYSADWIYIRTTGLATHIMGPWYLNAGKTQNFPNFPSNTAKTYRIPRSPVIPVIKTTTQGGATGYYVNGVAMFNMTDTFTYSNSTGLDVANGGDGIWVREAYHNEGVTFDPAFAHQAMNQYHYHAQPPGLRHQLGDHVDYAPATNTYTEAAGLPANHSPVIAWAADGLPVYGPYGYADPLVPTSGIKRMVSGFRLRAITTRTTLAAWSARLHGVSATLAANRYGPNVSATFSLGHYLEDYEYLGDVGQTQGVEFDLNEQNARWCVTPEFPAGTWSYFLTISGNGTPLFPFACGRQYFGSPTGSEMTSIPEAVTDYWKGGPNLTETNADIDASSDDVTVTWNVAEGGTYSVAASDTLSDFGPIASITATSDTLANTESHPKTAHPNRFYRISRTSLAPFDSSGFDYLSSGSASFTFNFTTTNPGLPPNANPVTVTVSGVTATITAYSNVTGAVAVTFNSSTLATGNHYATLSFTPPGQSTMQKVSTNFYYKAP